MHNHERKGEMLATAIRDAGIHSVESYNRRRHMLQAVMRGCWNRLCGELQPACRFANRQRRVLELMRKDASTVNQGAATGDEGCFHGDGRRAATGMGAVLQPAAGEL